MLSMGYKDVLQMLRRHTDEAEDILLKLSESMDLRWRSLLMTSSWVFPVLRFSWRRPCVDGDDDDDESGDDRGHRHGHGGHSDCL